MKTMNYLKGLSIAEKGLIKVTVPYIHCSEALDFFSSDYTGYVVYVDCENMVEFPLDGNPRFVDENSSSFKRNYSTLTTEVSRISMQDNQMGGDIFTNFLEIDRVNHSITFIFESTEMGLINGGTTMGACLKAKNLGTLKKGHNLSFRVRDYNTSQLSKEARLKCVENAISLNFVKPQKKENLCVQKGYFDEIYKHLNSRNKELICLRSGVTQYTKNEKFDGSILIRLLESWDIENYPSYSKCPKCVNSSYNKIITSFEKKMDAGLTPYSYLLPILNDMLDFYGLILYKWDSDSLEYAEKDSKYLEAITNLQSRNKKKGDSEEEFTVVSAPLKTPFSYNYPKEYHRRGSLRAESIIWALFSSFRANLIIDSESGKLCYRVPLMKLWSDCNIDLIQSAEQGLSITCKGIVKEFINKSEVWENMYKVVDSSVRRLEKHN